MWTASGIIERGSTFLVFVVRIGFGPEKHGDSFDGVLADCMREGCRAAEILNIWVSLVLEKEFDIVGHGVAILIMIPVLNESAACSCTTHYQAYGSGGEMERGMSTFVRDSPSPENLDTVLWV